MHITKKSNETLALKSILWYNTCMENEKKEIIMNDYADNWTDNTEANEDAVFLTQEEYDAEMKKRVK